MATKFSLSGKINFHPVTGMFDNHDLLEILGHCPSDKALQSADRKDVNDLFPYHLPFLKITNNHFNVNQNNKLSET